MGKIIKPDSAKGDFSGADRRKSARRPILDSFGFFVAVPSKGYHRLPVHDVSEHGVGFDFDIEGEEAEASPLKQGETMELHLYLNQSLYIPLNVKAVRIVQAEKGRSVGAEFEKLAPASAEAMDHLVRLLDSLSNTAQLVS